MESQNRNQRQLPVAAAVETATEAVAGGGGGGAKIDIYLLKTKNATKVLAAVKMCRACLLETQKKVEQVLQENKEINQMVTGFLYSILVWVRIWFKVMVDDMCDVHVSFDLPSLLSL